MAYRGKTKEDVVSEFRRDEILAAAHGVFATKGFRNATVSDIAEAAGLAKGTVYLYFTSKDELYWAALHRGLDTLHARTREAFERPAALRDKLVAFIDTKVRFFDAERDFFRIYLAEFGNVVPHHLPAQKEFERRYLEQVAMIDAAVQSAARQGTVRASVRPGIGFAIFGVAHSVITRRMRGWTQAPIEEDVSTAVDLLWKGLAQEDHA